MKRTSMWIKQRGVTLMELLVTLGLMSVLMVGLVNLLDNASDDAKSSVTALHAKTIGDAAGAYIKDNYGPLTSVATAGQPVLLRVSDLVATGYLTNGASAVNPRGQTTCVLILQPTANKLLGLVATEVGDTIDDLTLGQIASTIGGSGGGIYSTDPTILRGAMGGWEMPIGAFANPNHLGQRCDGTPGDIVFSAGHPVMALWFADGAEASATLYRDAVPGNPSLNTMNTPILMGAGTIQVEGSACATSGALGRDAAGAVLACESGEWKKGGSAYWKDPVASFGNLPACDASGLGHTRVVRTPGTGSGARAYSCDGTGNWQALGLDDSGNITIPGTATISQANVSRLGGNLEITSTAVEGTACSPNGRIARNTNGLILSCQSGVWRSFGIGHNSGLPGTFCNHTTYCGRSTGAALCHTATCYGGSCSGAGPYNKTGNVQWSFLGFGTYDLRVGTFWYQCMGGVTWMN